VVTVGPPTTPHAIQNAINAAATDSLLVLQPGVYHENVILWKRLKLQGLGPGGITGASELLQREPDDPRTNVQGTTIDGRFFENQDVKADYEATIATIDAAGPSAGLAGVDATHPVLKGADVTVVAKTPTAFGGGVDASTNFNAGRIDGLGLTTGRGEGAGGIQLQAFARRLQITNDVLESDGGIFAGGIGIGQPYFNSSNENVTMASNRVMGSGGLMRSGGIGIFRGADNYEVAGSIICSNFGVEYGSGISHWGLSPGGSIHDNKIYYNESFDSGAGIAISQETPQPKPGQPRELGDGSGPVSIERNLIQGNFSGDDGGGIFVQNAQTARINIRTNFIVSNGAADMGGGVMLDDSSNVEIVNNTVANNVTTGSSETSDGAPHAAGLAAEANDPLFTPPGNVGFSNPSALFNNIFWQNQAFTLSQPGPGATLVDHGFMDFEVHGTPGPASFTPRYSLVTNGPAGQGNVVGTNPFFVAPVVPTLIVAGSRLDPQRASVNITQQDPPVGLPGNWHLQIGPITSLLSGAVDRGVHCSNTPFPPPLNPLAGCGAGVEASFSDYDGQFRPQLRTVRIRRPWDAGADEIPTFPRTG
jgi:hypothetical protein